MQILHSHSYSYDGALPARLVYQQGETARPRPAPATAPEHLELLRQEKVGVGTEPGLDRLEDAKRRMDALASEGAKPVKPPEVTTSSTLAEGFAGLSGPFAEKTPGATPPVEEQPQATPGAQAQAAPQASPDKKPESL